MRLHTEMRSNLKQICFNSSIKTRDYFFQILPLRMQFALGSLGLAKFEVRSHKSRDLPKTEKLTYLDGNMRLIR